MHRIGIVCCLLAGCAAPSAAARVQGPEGSTPTPSRQDIVQAMDAIAPSISACAAGGRGLAPVRIVFDSSGAVVSATISSGDFPPSIRACIEAAARRASVPPFRNSTFSVNYPFRLGFD